MPSSSFNPDDPENTGAPPGSPDLLRAYLASGKVHCPNCRYNLQNLAGDRCPECGVRLRLCLRPVLVRNGPWVKSLLGLGLGEVFLGLALAFVLSTLGPRSLPEKMTWVTVIVPLL